MTFDASTFDNFIATASPVHARISPSYTGSDQGFDIIIIGSGFGGGILADDLADRIGGSKRILVIEAGSYLYPTHVYNCSRIPNGAVAARFACGSFQQQGHEGSEYYIHERPQMALGGRSIFWSGLIPTIQPWELEFFPDRVRADLKNGLLDRAGAVMNQSVTLGSTARRIVEQLNSGPLAADFEIIETPRALHQPYLDATGNPAEELAQQSTGVFNTAELLINQLGLSSDANPGGNGPGLRLALNHYVEDLKQIGDGDIEVLARNILDGSARYFRAGKVVLCGGAIESPKLLARSTLGQSLPATTRDLIGRGLTDHPTTHEIHTVATHIGNVRIPKHANAKIIFHSRGTPGADGLIRYPFNVEMNINHEYWHLRENDPSSPETPIADIGDSVIDIKFSFGNCLDRDNRIHPAPPFGYCPQIQFRNQSWTGYLTASRLPALAGWHKTDTQVFDVLNEVTNRIFSEFSRSGQPCQPADGARYGANNKGFGSGTVHHAAGSLSMPFRPSHDAPIRTDSVIDEDLRVNGAAGLYVCDMSVMPFASAANPVRTLTALALRLSAHFG
jgi:choline dehydrogenase-like flavoprotein